MDDTRAINDSLVLLRLTLSLVAHLVLALDIPLDLILAKSERQI